MRLMMLYKQWDSSRDPKTRVRITNGRFTVTDGSFPETTELVSGFAIEVVDEGESDIRLMHDTPAFDAASASQSGKAGQTPGGKTDRKSLFTARRALHTCVKVV